MLVFRVTVNIALTTTTGVVIGVTVSGMVDRGFGNHVGVAWFAGRVRGFDVWGADVAGAATLRFWERPVSFWLGRGDKEAIWHGGVSFLFFFNF